MKNRLLLPLLILVASLIPRIALAGFGADIKGLSYSGTAQVDSWIHLNVEIQNLSTPDSGYGGAATFCVVCTIDPPGWFNDFDQEKAGQSFGLYETKTIAMPDVLLDDDGDWAVDCQVLDAGCSADFDAISGNITVSPAPPPSCDDYPSSLGSCGAASSDGECMAGGQEVWECTDMGPVNCWVEVESCSGTSVCLDTTFGAATCIDDGHADFCKAWKNAGSGCVHGESDCDGDGECLGNLECMGPVFPFSGQDGCCNPGEAWDGDGCIPGDCAGLGYPLGECGATNDGDCKDNYNQVWTCVDAGPLNCWDLTDTCNGDTVCYDALGAPAACIGPGHMEFCKAWKDAGSGCVYGESDCDGDGECLGALECVGPTWPFSGQDGCCNPGEGWDGEDCIPNDCDALGYPLGECAVASSLGACAAGWGAVWTCVDAGPINCYELTESCAGGVCHVSSWDGAASCVYPGDDPFCAAMKSAGSGCDYGESDCDWDSECLGDLECTGPLLQGPDGCCNPGDGWDGAVCIPGDCAALGYPLGDCDGAASDGDCAAGFGAVWECVDAGPVNCWEVKETCSGGAVCFDSWSAPAVCVPPSHEDFCHAMEAAGSGCAYGQSDCDSNGECLGDLVCVGPLLQGVDGCCNAGEDWDGVACSGAPPDDPQCPAGCLQMGAMSDGFEMPFPETTSANGLWEKQSGPWHCTLSPGQVSVADGALRLGVTAGGVACGQVDAANDDFFYGSYRASMKTPSAAGTCTSMFFYGGSGVGEVDIEILSSEDGAHTVHFSVQPTGGQPCGSANHKCHTLPTAPSAAFHEYGFDILPGEVVFFVDGVEVAAIQSFVPETPGRLIFNHWAGNPDWTGAPPSQDSTALIEWFEYAPAGYCAVCGQCGNDVVNPSEDCDGPFLDGATCASLGYGSGALDCSGCAYDVSGCAVEASCGDGLCDADEGCEDCPADCGVCPLMCGDAICSPGETCADCPADCGDCCGNGSCEPAFGEDCEACAADCGVCPPKCGNGACDPGESCKDCSLDCGPCCGNGICEPDFGEDCVFCAADCGACPAGCGDGFCGDGESCASCPADCGACCGDGICQAAFGEQCSNCPADCGPCGVFCPDEVCQDAESCASCPSDCGACCGDGKCDPSVGEDCLFCPGDCGDCGGGCGDGVCGAEEHCASCGLDCGDCCGNGACDAAWGEDCETCAGDCGACAGTCKDGVCQDGETCQSCPSDCGACCGDGICDPGAGEDCIYCPEDCPQCGCTPDCLGVECGSDGCGGFCGTCPEDYTCQSGICNSAGVPGADTTGGVDTIPWDPNWAVETDREGTKSGGCAAASVPAPAIPLLLFLVLGLLLLRRRSCSFQRILRRRR